jgi:hypothetical protein
MPTYNVTTTITDAADIEHEVVIAVGYAFSEPDVGIMEDYIDELELLSYDGRKLTRCDSDVALEDDVLAFISNDRVMDLLADQHWSYEDEHDWEPGCDGEASYWPKH